MPARLISSPLFVLAFGLSTLACPGGGGCESEDYEGNWIVTQILDASEACCEGQMQVSIGFVATGDVDQTTLWEKGICRTPEELEAAGITLESTWPGGLHLSTKGTCSGTIPRNYPSALESVPNNCP